MLKVGEKIGFIVVGHDMVMNNVFQWMWGKLAGSWQYLHPEVQDGCHDASNYMLNSELPASKRNIGNFFDKNMDASHE